jgi:single-strand DNA-binding protein
MAATNVNRIVISGNITRNPELRPLPSGGSVCKLRLANNTRRRQGDEWVDKPNFFDVTVWGGQGENCARVLTKGSPITVDGRLEWREFEIDDTTGQAVEIVAENVQFHGSPSD